MQKKNLVMMAMATLIVYVFFGCGKMDKPKRCEQLYETQQIPELSKNEYNTCDAVHMNYAYFVRWNNVKEYLKYYPNPVESLMQDTVLMCGFIKHSYGKPFDYAENGWWLCSMIDDSITAMDPENHFGGIIYVQGDDKTVLNEIDDTKKCYLIGVMTYDTPFYFLDSPADPSSCSCLKTFFQVVQIKN